MVNTVVRLRSRISKFGHCFRIGVRPACRPHLAEAFRAPSPAAGQPWWPTMRSEVGFVEEPPIALCFCLGPTCNGLSVRLAPQIRHMQQFRRFPLCRFTAPVVAGSGLHVGMSSQLLRCRNVRAGIEQVRNKRPAKIMR